MRVGTLSVCCAVLIFAVAVTSQAAGPESMERSRKESPAAGTSEPFMVTTPPSSPVNGYATMTAGREPGEMIGYVATPERGVKVRMRMNTIYTEDGYSLRVQVLMNDDELVMMHFLARGPAGQAAEGLAKGWKRTNQMEHVGLDHVRNLLSQSADFALLTSVVPPMADTLRSGPKVATNSCEAMVLTMVGTTISAMAICTTVETTGNIMGCIGALVALAGQLWNLYSTCGVLDVCGDGPCPTMDEPPPCASYSIC